RGRDRPAGRARLARLCRDQAIPAGRHAGLTEQQRRRVQRHIRGCLFICRPRAAKGRDRGEWTIGPALAKLAEAGAGRPALPPPVDMDRERRRPGAAPGSAGPPRTGLARLIQRGSDLLTTGTVRITHLPGVATTIRFTGDNPRTASAVAVTMVAVTAGVILALSPGTP